MDGTVRPLILLDRDGVINEDRPQGVTCLAEFVFISGVLEAIATLTRAGFHLAVVSNQSGVAKGLLSETTLQAIHDYLIHRVAEAGGRIDAVYVCTDHPDHPTHRRKPGSGMIEEALHDFHAAAAHTPVIGDDLRDLEAARNAGCPRLLVKTGKGQFLLNKGVPLHVQPVEVFDNVAAATPYLIRHFA